MTEHLSPVAEGYDDFLHDLKERICNTQVKAALAVSHELMTLYWNVGRQLIAEQMRCGWGAKVIDRLAADLRHAFPEMKGFSSRNLKYMPALAGANPDAEFVQQPVAQIACRHNLRILDGVNYPNEREWYLRQTRHTTAVVRIGKMLDFEFFPGKINELHPLNY